LLLLASISTLVGKRPQELSVWQQTTAKTVELSGESMSWFRLLVATTAVGAFLALSTPAMASDATMTQLWDGSRFLGKVHYVEPGLGSAGERNDVTVSMPSSTRLAISDPGAFIWSGWGWGQDHGCVTTTGSSGTAATCDHPNGVVSLFVELGAWSDHFALDVSANRLAIEVRGGSYNDTIDVRDGFGDDSVDCGTGFDFVFHDPGDVVLNCESESLGGHLATSPAVASWASGRLDVIWRGTGGDLRHEWFNGSWSAEESLGGQITSAPAAVSWGPSRLDVFARGTAGDLVHTWYDGSWHPWESLGGQLAAGSGPTVSSWASGRLDVFWRGTGNDLRHKAFSGGWWPEESLGGVIMSDPEAVSWTLHRIDVFARGQDNALWHRWYDAGWFGWESLGGQLIGGPAVASTGPGELVVFVRGMDSGLWVNSYDAGWLGWDYAGGRGQISSDPAAVSWGQGRVDAFWRGRDNALWHTWSP
jgi:Repeat of unknown function (DUF346)